MSLLPGPANPIVYAQFVLQGRWRRIGIASFVYAGLVVGVISLISIGQRKFTPQDYLQLLATITGLQIFVLLLFGAFQVERAVRGDVTSRMLESHRLMPASPLGCVLGYLFGAPMQALAIVLVNLTIGAVCCVFGQMPLGGWVMVNAALLLFALMVYAIIMQTAFTFPVGFLLLLVAGGILAPLSADGSLIYVPSLDTLFYPFFSRGSVFVHAFGPGGWLPPSDFLPKFCAAFAGQIVITCIAIRVSVRRYVSSSAIGISAPLGLMLLVTWLALAGMGLTPLQLFLFSRTAFTSEAAELLARQIVVSIIGFMLLALLPISAAARSRFQSPPPAAISGPKRTIPSAMSGVLLAALGFLALFLAYVAYHMGQSNWNKTLISLLIVLNFFLLVACLFAHGYQAQRRPWIVVAILVLLLCLVPVIADAIYVAVNNLRDQVTELTTISPPAALAILWTDTRENVWPGIAIQMVLTAGALALNLFAWQRRRMFQSRSR